MHQAFATRQIPAIFHSDQDTEFIAQQCTDYLEDRGVHTSVSDIASPLKKSFVESFYGRFKQELGDLARFTSVGEMIEAIYQHIRYYNNSHIHSALKMPPAVYVAQAFSDTGLRVLGT